MLLAYPVFHLRKPFNGRVCELADWGKFKLAAWPGMISIFLGNNNSSGIRHSPFFLPAQQPAWGVKLSIKIGKVCPQKPKPAILNNQNNVKKLLKD